MYTCRACMRRASSTLVDHTLRFETTLATARPSYASIQPRQQKRYATATATVRATKQDDADEDERTSRRVSPREWAANKQLQYLTDPLHIADYVRKTLARGNFEEAALITRKASKDTKVVVSWNHLIDHELQHDKLHAGIKLYNEMKKRAQLPNAQTFTIIFRGCATSSHAKLAVSEAVRIYNNLLSNDRIKPNTIHMNAVLQVCAKAGDIESLFSIIQTANESTRAPNNMTYTTVLNALRSQISKRQPAFTTEAENAQLEATKKETIQRATAIWEEVISKWRSGSVIVDEELVCAMGRILLMGGYHDANSIEALLEQTMMIPREDKAKILNTEREPSIFSENNTSKKLIPSNDSRKIKAPGAPAINHALPGNNSLSMILSALEKTGKTTKSQRYWDIFTKKHGVVPDANNWHQLLTALRRGKNSAKTVSYLRDMPAELAVVKNFRTAMNTCLRDNLNRSSFDHATEVLKIMLAKLHTPDLQTLRTYLQVAYANKRYFMEQSTRDYEAATRAWGKQISTALDNLWKPYMTIAKLCENDGPESNLKRELVALARKMIAACDRIISSNMVPPEIEAEIKPRRNSLNRVVVRHFEQMAEIDPNFRQSDNASEDHEDENGFDEFANQFQKRRDTVETKRRKTTSW
ncbi:hypothetical protein M426DRAFT_20560 [Hypoxylon sp. CI-4A]|nr:hypothetical protein M426DRAFT_20560 [Hypoxylon sp. CI-4A]